MPVNMVVKSVSIISISVFALTGAAIAKDNDGKRGKRNMEKMIEKIDTDKSGTLSLEEFANVGLGKMIEADKDGDGILTQDEITAQMEAERQRRRQERLTRRLDVNGDGEITVAEIKDMQQKQFAVLDRNSDGVLSTDELKKARKMKKSLRK